MIEKLPFFDYARYDEQGICGIKDNAPDDIKKEFEKWFKQYKENLKNGIH